MILWLFNLQYRLLTDFYSVFFFMLWCGLPGGTAYSNFLYLANTRTKLECDFKLHYTERELTVNLLLIAQDVGIVVAAILGIYIQGQWYPETLDNPPS